MNHPLNIGRARSRPLEQAPFLLFIYYFLIFAYFSEYVQHTHTLLVQYMQLDIHFYTLFYPFTTLLFCAENSLSSISLFPRKIAWKSRVE